MRHTDLGRHFNEQDSDRARLPYALPTESLEQDDDELGNGSTHRHAIILCCFAAGTQRAHRSTSVRPAFPLGSLGRKPHFDRRPYGVLEASFTTPDLGLWGAATDQRSLEPPSTTYVSAGARNGKATIR